MHTVKPNCLHRLKRNAHTVGAKFAKTIYVDLALRQLKLTNVDFYDFMYLREVTGLTGECGVVSNSLNGREIYIMYTPNQEYYVMCVDVTLSEMPSVFKLYKDAEKRTYDIYYR